MTEALVNPECPRCGYDLRGELARWEDRCPVEGRCNECGLIVRWGEVLQPHRYRPIWCVEYRPRWFQVPGGTAVTLLRSLRPRRFWSQLKMTQPLRPARLAVYVMLVTLLPAFGYTVEQGLVAWRVRNLAAPQGLARRAPWPAARRTRRPPPTPRVRPPLGPVLAEAIATPTASTSRVRAVGIPLGAYPPPRALHRLLEGRRRGTMPFGRLVERSLFGYLYGLGIFALVPMGFVLLPISRRRSRVRWAHIARITVYGWGIPAVVATLFFALVAGAFLLSPFRGLAFALALGITCWVMVPALVLWWARAIDRYLRMPNAWAVAIIFTLLAFLMILAWLYLGWREAALRVIEPLVW